MVSSYVDTNDIVSDYLVSQFSDSACKLDSSSVVDCLTTTALSTSACEMNNVNSVQIAPHPVAVLSRRPAHSTYLRLTHKPWASYGHALGLSDWRLVSGFDCVGTPE